MGYSYILSPTIGVARLGDSREEFYLAPTKIGGLPRECDANGNETEQGFSRFKDQEGRVKRQAQDFRIYRTQNNKDFEEVTLTTAGVQSIDWTVHLANKKAAWYQFSELQGNLLLGPNNSYANQGIPLRNSDPANPKIPKDRKKLIIDPGPRTISGKNQSKEIGRDNIPQDYPSGSFPNPRPQYGWPINSLGTIKTDSQGRLLVLGAYGSAGGDKKIESYGGADTWFDDIADGVVNVTVKFTSGDPVQLSSWVICASPDFAPEIVNISTLDDTMFDVGVRYFKLMPEMYSNGTWQKNFVASYQRDILPIIQRISRYQWVSNVQSMSAFCSSQFDFGDPSPKNAANRQHYFSYFRDPTIYTPDAGTSEKKGRPSSTETTMPAAKKTDGGSASYLSPASAISAASRQAGGTAAVLNPKKPEEKRADLPVPGKIEGGSATLFSPDKHPMMPLNAGSNPVNNTDIEKFLTLNQTQYFLLQQWAAGTFVNDPNYQPYPVWSATQAAVGNCVGLPMCPGIEVTWSMQNPLVYKEPYVIAQSGNEESYKKQGLAPSRDETEGGGCEPGDLTKRMAIPWQADFFNCTIQYINFTRPEINKDKGQPVPPTYYAYWWPPQAPWDVISGAETEEGQKEAHVPAGVQVNYLRGINSYVQMVTEWSYLGFIRNQNTSETADTFPYLVETERLHEHFAYKAVPVSQISGNEQDAETTIPVFYSLQPEALPTGVAGTLLKRLTAELFQEIEVAENIILQVVPRSGTRDRF